MWERTSSNLPRIQLHRGCRVGLPQGGLSSPRAPVLSPTIDCPASSQIPHLQSHLPPGAPTCSEHTLYVHK